MTDLLQDARKRGADFVMPRSMFTGSLVDILQRLAGSPDSPGQN
jgi:hypothetical protein